MSKRILLADDSVTIQKVIAITFADKEFDLTTVGDGNAAVSRVREINPDIVLADVSMPEKNGYEVCKEIKDDAQLHDIPVLLLAGTFEPYNEEEGKRVGADDFILKPFESQELIEKVESLLSSSHSSADEESDVQSLPTEEVSDDFVRGSSFEALPGDETEQTAGFAEEGAAEPEEEKDDWDISDIDDFMEVEEDAITSNEFDEETSPEEGDKEENFQLLEGEDFGDLLEDESRDEVRERDETMIGADVKQSLEAGEELNDENGLELLDELEPIEILAEVGEDTSKNEAVNRELHTEEADLLAKPELEDLSFDRDERLDSEDDTGDFELEEHFLDEIDLEESSAEGGFNNHEEQTVESEEVSGEYELEELSTDDADLLDESSIEDVLGKEGEEEIEEIELEDISFDEPELVKDSTSEEFLQRTEGEASEGEKAEEPVIEEPDLLEDSALDDALSEEDITEMNDSEPDVEEDTLSFETSEKIPIEISAPAATVLETKVKEGLEESLSSEHVEQLVNKVVREVVEKVAWDIVPGLIESVIQEEIKKVREAISKTG